MQETSGSRSYQPVGSARTRFADLSLLPIPYLSSSRSSRPVFGATLGRLGNSGAGIPDALPTTRQASGCNKVAGLKMTFDSSCLCHRGFQNELMDG
jgi:hypothetical protein